MTAEEYARLEAAERVCLMVGWNVARSEHDRDKALTELWQQWHRLVPPEFTARTNHPEFSDEAIAEMAQRRDETRARTLERIRRTGR